MYLKWIFNKSVKIVRMYQHSLPTSLLPTRAQLLAGAKTVGLIEFTIPIMLGGMVVVNGYGIVGQTLRCSAAFHDELSRTAHDQMDTPWIQELMKNGDCKIGSQSDNTVGSPHGFIIHGIVISKNIKEVMEVIDVENWHVDNSWVLRWIVSLFEWNSPISSTKSSIKSTFRFRVVVRLHDLKLKTLGKRGIECIIVGYAEHSKAIRPSLMVLNGTDDIGGSMVLKEDDPKTFDEAMKSKDVAF
ncbi:hypothetical protein Tco_0268618 [Tanacetum coccineum]